MESVGGKKAREIRRVDRPVEVRSAQVLAPLLLPPPTVVTPLNDPPGPGIGGGKGPDLRVKAEWSARAEALAAQAVAAGAGAKTVTLGLSRALAAWAEAPEAHGAKISLWVAEAGISGDPLFAIGADEALNPASNSKLATAIFALAALGPEHQFTTSVFLADDGVLYLRGGFDPTLTAHDLEAIGQALAAHGVAEVTAVVLDESCLSGPGVPAGFDKYGDQDWSYLAPISPLAVDKNLVELVVRPGPKVGAPATVEASQDAFTVEAQVTTTAPGTPFKVGCDERDQQGTLIRGEDGRGIIQVQGTIALDYKKGKRLVMKSPAPFDSFADRISAGLRSAGLEVGPVRAGRVPSTLSPLFQHHSAPLSEILKESIATSNAFDHEMFLVAAALAETGRPTISQEDALGALGDFLRDALGLDAAVMKNGSGIGNLNRLSARDVGQILGVAHQTPAFSALLNGLARPGQPGTLATRMLGTAAEGRLSAKTGTGEDGVALSGVVTPRTGPPLVFSCLINDPPAGRRGARALLDALGIVLSSFSA